MERIAFKMNLFPGYADEYKKRHNAIWPEVAALLKGAGATNYSIFLDEETNTLIGVMTVPDRAGLDKLPETEGMQRWWKHMSDIMESNPDNSPVVTPLPELFYLP